MKRNRVLIIKISCCVLFKVVMAQYDNFDFKHMQQFQYPYKNPVDLFRLYPPQVLNLKDNLSYEEYDYNDDENVCSCVNCDNLKPSCQNMCPNCARVSLTNSGYVFIPFPYPYPVVTKTTIQAKKLTKVTTQPTTKSTATTAYQKSTTEVERTFDEQTDATITDKLVESKVPDVAAKSLEVKDKSPYMLTSNLTSLRRTKPNWIPNYGIVPISNKFAEKLMLQLRNMKVLHSPKDYLRDVDEITPIN